MRTPGSKRQPGPLILHLKWEYWEAIRDGRKLEEYRERTPYWEKRLRGKVFSEIILHWAYPERGDETWTLHRKWNGLRETDIDTPVYGGLVPVFAIDVSEAA